MCRDSYYDNVGGGFSTHARLLDTVYLMDKAVEAVSDLLCRPLLRCQHNRQAYTGSEYSLSALTAVSPNVPWLISIHTLRRASGNNLRR
jgi:hypothetical protein